MPILTDWEITLSVDDVLRSQGAIPEIVRKRSAGVVETTEKALAEAQQLIHPFAVVKMLDVLNDSSNALVLADGSIIQGEFVAHHLSKVKRVCAAACTVSEEISLRISEISKSDIVYALALDGAASKAVEILSNEVYGWIKKQAAQEGWTTTLPLNPGMRGWPLQDGQHQIFSILSKESPAIYITESCVIQPMKSLSLLVGMGSGIKNAGKQCDYCMLRNSCKFRNGGAQENNETHGKYK